MEKVKDVIIGAASILGATMCCVFFMIAFEVMYLNSMIPDELITLQSMRVFCIVVIFVSTAFGIGYADEVRVWLDDSEED